MIRRTLVSIVLAAAVTLGLLFLMQSLIAISGRGNLEEVTGRVVDFVRIKKETRTETKRRRPPARVQPPEPPPPPEIDLARAPRPRGAELGAVAPVGLPSFEMARGPGAAMSDMDVLPLVRIEPRYPSRALSRKIEGWVQLEFTITPAGSVRDIVVVDSEPPGIFDRAATGAVAKWKYKPKIVEGTPVERTGVQVVLTFKIEN